MKPLLIFASGLLVGYLLRQRRVVRQAVVDTDYQPGDAWPPATEGTVSSATTNISWAYLNYLPPNPGEWSAN